MSKLAVALAEESEAHFLLCIFESHVGPALNVVQFRPAPWITVMTKVRILSLLRRQRLKF